MSSKLIKEKLSKMGYKQNEILLMNGGGYKVFISGSVHIQEIKDNFNVTHWEYSGNKVAFNMKEKKQTA